MSNSHDVDAAGSVIALSPDELRSEGGAALQRREPDAAEATFRALLAVEPTNIYALVGIGSASRLRGDHFGALQRFGEAAAVWPSHPWPLLEISGQLEAMGLLDEAETALRRALELSPHYYHVLMALARLLRRRGDHENAAEMFGTAAKCEPAQTSAYIERAVELICLGRQDEAISTLDAGVEVCAEKIAFTKAKARILRASGQNEAALAALVAASADKPDDSAIKLEIAAEAQKLGRFGDALAAYQAVIDNGQIAAAQRRDAALSAARLARDRMNSEPIAIGLYEQAVALDANDDRISCELAHQYRMASRLKDAETIYRKILDRSPINAFALSGLATVRRLVGDTDEAFELLNKAIAIDPKHEWNRLELGYLLRDLGRNEEAVAITESIDRSSIVYVHARMSLGHMAQARDDLHRAVDYFEQAAEMASDPTEALRYIASARLALGDLSEAKLAIARLFARDSESYYGHMADGSLKRAMNNHHGALSAFLRAAAILPTAAKPLIEIAIEQRALGDPNAAHAAIEAALKIDPKNEEALLKQGAYLSETGNVDAALSIYAKLREMHPGSIWAHLSAAQLLAQKGEFEAGLALLMVARKNCRTNAMVGFREATILWQQGFLDESYERLSATNTRFPREFWPWYSRTKAAIDLGYFDSAEALLLAAPRPAAVHEQGHKIKLSAHLDHMRWTLEAAIDLLGTAIDLDANDSEAVYERAKLKLITFDFSGAKLDLTAYAEMRSTSAKREVNPLHSHVGQLYEEFVLDRSLAADLTSLRRLSPEDQVTHLVELVRRSPDSTAPAIGLMIALRRLGLFNLPQPSQNITPRIPQLITQFWNDSEPPSDVRRLMDSWKEADTRFKVELFDDVSAISYLRERCDPVIARAFSRAVEPTQRADLFRLARLFVEGGYFIDADDCARGGLAKYVPPHVEFFAHQEDLGSIGNNVLGAAPGHPAIELALREAVVAILRGDRDLIWLATGPGLLTRSLARWLAAEPSGGRERLAGVSVLTLTEIRRAAAIHCHAAYKNSSRAWLSGAFAKSGHRQ